MPVIVCVCVCVCVCVVLCCVQFMWYGDRWQSSPNGMKGDDFTFWSPLTFTADGNLTSFEWQNNFVVSVGL